MGLPNQHNEAARSPLFAAVRAVVGTWHELADVVRHTGWVSHYFAAYCRTGHLVDSHVLDPDNRTAGTADAYASVVLDEHEVVKFCGRCGSSVLLGCEGCGHPFSARAKVPGQPPPPFCVECGEPLPWANRAQRIGKLRDVLQAEEIDEGDRLRVLDAIAVLSEPEPDESDGVGAQKRKAAWQTIKKLAPKTAEAGTTVLTGVLSAAARAVLGLP